MGTLYAILLGLIVVDATGRFDRAANIVSVDVAHCGLRRRLGLGCSQRANPARRGGRDSKAQITDAGFVQLTGLTNLRLLHLRGTRVSNDGSKELTLALLRARFRDDSVPIRPR